MIALGCGFAGDEQEPEPVAVTDSGRDQAIVGGHFLLGRIGSFEGRLRPRPVSRGVGGPDLDKNELPPDKARERDRPPADILGSVGPGGAEIRAVEPVSEVLSQT